MSDNDLSLPARIYKLPDRLANQIAAGEVIERPASVVKELLENSIDAGATNITVDIRKGGTQLIRVADNGHGIHPEDLQLALASHATSKLQEQSDLYCINSLGFRGEALSSIAAVADFKITSRMYNVDQGYTLTNETGSAEYTLTPVAHPVGTTVEVTKLFHITPARRKFLRSERTEFLHVLEMVRRLSLSRFGITIKLKHNGKTVFDCRAVNDELGSRVAGIMGKGFVREALVLDASVADMRIWGWLGNADLSRSQTDRQYFFLNGRIIRDKQINHAVRSVFASKIPTGRYPVYALYLEMDTAVTDINVHPTKHEVRFRNARDVYDFIYASLENTLTDGPSKSGSPEQGIRPASGARVIDGSYPQNSTSAYYSKETPPAYKYADTGEYPGSALSNTTLLGQPLTQLQGRFILTMRNSALVLIDVDAARRQIIHAKITKELASGAVRQRPLLVPVTIPVSQVQAEQIESQAEVFNRYGLSLERISPQSVMVRAIPVILQDVHIQSLLHDIAAALDRPGSSLADAIVTVYEQHAIDTCNPELNMTEIYRCLRALEDCGLDMTVRDHAGLWKTLDMRDLQSLI